MAAPPSVFFVGAGFIGHPILDILLAENYPVTVLTRRPEQASLFEKAGARTIAGTLNDLELITAQAAKHDVTINTASSDDLPSVDAILSGVRQRVHAGQSSIYLHTSGTGVLEDGALGRFKNDKIYRDDVPGDIDAIQPSAMHRDVDIHVSQAAREFGEKAKVAIILPPLVYGFNSRHNRQSVAVPIIARLALKRGVVGYIGEGRNVWSTIHVNDLAHAYITLLNYFIKSAPPSYLENPYFFVENGSEISIHEVSEIIGQAFHAAGRIQNPTPEAFADSVYSELFGPMILRAFGCNSRSRAVRLRELGWEPKDKDIWTSCREDDIPALLAE